VLEVDDLVKRSSRARNRSFEPIVLCFFGRIVPLRRRRQNHASPERESQK
jgi:hypothetical protein